MVSPRRMLLLSFFLLLLLHPVFGENDKNTNLSSPDISTIDGVDISFFVNILSSCSTNFYLTLDSIYMAMEEINQHENKSYEIIGLLPGREVFQSQNNDRRGYGSYHTNNQQKNMNSDHPILRCTTKQQAMKFTKRTGILVTLIDQEVSTPFLSHPLSSSLSSPCFGHDIQLKHFWGSLPPSNSPSPATFLSLSEWMKTAEQQSKGSSLFFISDFVTLTSDSILSLLSSSSSSEASIVGPMLQSPSGKIFSAGIGLQMSASAVSQWATPTLSVAPFHIFGGGSPPLPDGLSPPIAISHHCLVVSRDTYTRVEGFNMTFYPDFHDLDFSLRVKEAIEKEKEEEKGKRENEVDGDMMRKENEEKEREIVKVLSLSVIFNKETPKFDNEKIPSVSCLSCEYCDKMPIFEDVWREKLIHFIQESYQNDIRIIWTMECGAGQVRGFSDEAISFLIPLEKMISIHADVNNVEACHELLSSYPHYVQCGMQRMIQKPLPPSPPLQGVEDEEKEDEETEKEKKEGNEGEEEEKEENQEEDGEQEEKGRGFISRTVNVIHKSPGSFESAPGWVYQGVGGQGTTGEESNRELFLSVGRCMYESHVVPKEWAKQIRAKNLIELWVPSVFNMYTFWKSGVPPSLLSLLQQGVDASFFDSSLPHPSLRPLFLEAFSRAGGVMETEKEKREEGDLYVFLSIFKFEDRKGWKELMSAYTQEFSKKKDKVLLLVVSHTDDDNMKEIEDYLEVRPFSPVQEEEQEDDQQVRDENAEDDPRDNYRYYYDDVDYYPEDYAAYMDDETYGQFYQDEDDSYLNAYYEEEINENEEMGEGIQEEEDEKEGKEADKIFREQPIVLFLRKHLTAEELVALYSSVDAFVLPSRGEGWGRPLIEAMSMSLPVISTNWSGMTEFMTSENSYLLPVEEFVPANGGHLWALPSISKLQETMRYLFTNKEEGRQKGKMAREDILKKFSPKVMAETVVEKVEMLVQKEEKQRKKEEKEEKKEEVENTKQDGEKGFPCLSHRVRVKRDQKKPSFPHPFQGDYPYQIEQ